MVELEPVDAVEVTLVVDNYVDILAAGVEGVRRFPMAYDFSDGEQLMAEHGFSALVTVFSNGSRSSILYDGGMTPGALATTSRSWRSTRPACGPSSSPTATSTTTAVSRAWPPATGAAGCPC